MKVALPDSSQVIASEDFLVNTSWFTFFHDIWRAIRGGLGISIGGTLSTNTTSSSNSGSVETTMMSYTVGRNTLKNDGDEIYIKAWGVFAANANNKTIKLQFGGQTILNTGAVAANNGSWQIEASVIKKTATQEVIATIISDNTSVANSSTRTIGTQDLTISNNLSLTGQGISSNDIVQHAMLIKLTPKD